MECSSGICLTWGVPPRLVRCNEYIILYLYCAKHYLHLSSHIDGEL